MNKLAKRLTKAFSNDIVLGVVFSSLVAFAKTIVPTLLGVTAIVALVIGLGGTVRIAFSEDVDEV